MLQFAVKLTLTAGLVACCAVLARKFPSLAGLIAVMPITSLAVLLWVYSDDPGNMQKMTDLTKAAAWGILPTILFFISAYLCFRKGLALGVVLAVSFGVWVFGALVHQWFLHK